MKTSFSSFHPPTQHLTAQLNSSPTGATMGPFPPKAGHQLQLNWQPAGIHTCHGGGFQPPSRWRPVRGVGLLSDCPSERISRGDFGERGREKTAEKKPDRLES